LVTTPLTTLEIDRLADALARGEGTEADRDARWRTLLFCVILPRAECLEAQLGLETLLDVVLEVMPRRLANYRQEKGRFASWLETTLRNLGRDEIRRRKRWTSLSYAAELAQPEPEDEDSPTEVPAEERLRQALGQMEAAPRSSRQKTDFHAVLLVSLRLAVVSRLKRSRKLLAAHGESRTERAVATLPWSRADESRVIQRGWPDLTRVWRVLATNLEAGGVNPTDDRLAEWLGDEPGVLGLSAEGWRQWRKRAIASGRKVLGEELWEADVAGWMETALPRRCVAR